MEDNFSTDQEAGNGMVWGRFKHIYIYCVLYFYYYNISSTSDHQALVPEAGDPGTEATLLILPTAL